MVERSRSPSNVQVASVIVVHVLFFSINFMEIFNAFLYRSTIHYNSITKCYSLFVTLNPAKPIMYYVWCYYSARVLFALKTHVSTIHVITYSRPYWYLSVCLSMCISLCVIECGNQARIDHDHCCLYKAIVVLFVISLLNSNIFNILERPLERLTFIIVLFFLELAKW